MTTQIPDSPASTDFLGALGLLALGSRLRRISDRIMANGADIYREAGVDFEPRWFPVFRFLADHELASVGEIARGIGFTHAAVSQTATQMRRRGVLSITKDPGDERRRNLALTPAGRALLPDLRAVWADIEEAAREIVDHSGVCVLSGLDGMENAMDQESLLVRTRKRRQAREIRRVEILDFKPRFAAAFKQLNLEWLERYFRVEPCDAVMLDHPKREIIARGGHILFARKDGEIVGCVGLLPRHKEPRAGANVKAKAKARSRSGVNGDELELIKMAVTERHRGAQIGRRLMTAAIERAQEVGAKAIVLETNSGLLPAVSLYRKAGFQVTGSGPSTTYERGDLFMRLDLE